MSVEVHIKTGSQLSGSSKFFTVFLWQIIVRLTWNGNTLRFSSKSTIFKQKIHLNCPSTMKFQDLDVAHAYCSIWSCSTYLKDYSSLPYFFFDDVEEHQFPSYCTTSYLKLGERFFLYSHLSFTATYSLKSEKDWPVDYAKL